MFIIYMNPWAKPIRVLIYLNHWTKYVNNSKLIHVLQLIYLNPWTGPIRVLIYLNPWTKPIRLLIHVYLKPWTKPIHVYFWTKSSEVFFSSELSLHWKKKRRNKKNKEKTLKDKSDRYGFKPKMYGLDQLIWTRRTADCNQVKRTIYCMHVHGVSTYTSLG